MSDPFSQIPYWQAQRLATLMEALGDPLVSQSELTSITCIAGQQLATVQNLAAVIRRSRSGSDG